jgi:hypothetical protein
MTFDDFDSDSKLEPVLESYGALDFSGNEYNREDISIFRSYSDEYHTRVEFRDKSYFLPHPSSSQWEEEVEVMVYSLAIARLEEKRETIRKTL